jgi:hypothetical protein
MGWVDRQSGLVAIPIERAMELLVADPDPAAPINLPTAPAVRDVSKPTP